MRHLASAGRSGLATATMLALLLATPGTSAFAEQQVPIWLPATTPLETKNVMGSISYLKARYGVDERDALRRLELQRISPTLDNELAKRYPDSFAGTYLDQQNGGLLIVRSKDVGTTESALRKFPDARHVKVQTARWSLKELRAAEDRVVKELNLPFETTKRKAEVAIDVEANSVMVWQREGSESVANRSIASANKSKAEQTLLGPAVLDSAFVAAESGRVQLRQMVIGDDKEGSASLLDTPVSGGCDPRYCSPPMRGGMRLVVRRSQQAPTWPTTEYLNGWYGQCTNGFNVTDDWGWNYIMTAGHCMVGQYKVGINHTYYTNWTPISDEVHNYENGCSGSSCGSTYPVDYSIQPYSQTCGGNCYDYWLGPYAKSLVMSWCWWSQSTWTGCQDGSFYIHGQYSYGQIGTHWIVCGTGSGDADSSSGYQRNIGYWPGTRCGEITGKDGGLKTNICTRPGDSGGPLFSELDGRAYGILSHGYRGSGNCPNSPPGTEWSNYSPVSKIFEHIAIQLGLLGEDAHNFRLQTSP